MVKRYVHEIEPCDRAQICDDDLGPDEVSALDGLIASEFLTAAMLRLKPREERVIRLLYGIGGVGETTFREIGDELGLSVQSVRQIHAKSIRKLRWHARRYYPERRINQVPRTTMPRTAPSRAQSRAQSRAKSRPSSVSPVRSGKPVQDRRPRNRTAVPVAVPGRPRLDLPKPQAGESVPSGVFLYLVIAAFLVALGLDPTIAYNLATVIGTAATLFVHAGMALSGLVTATIVFDDLSYGPPPSIAVLRQRWPAPRCALLLMGSLACLLPPLQQVLEGMVAATPEQFRNPTPRIVALFAALTFAVCMRYLFAQWKQRKSLMRV